MARRSVSSRCSGSSRMSSRAGRNQVSASRNSCPWPEDSSWGKRSPIAPRPKVSSASLHPLRAGARLAAPRRVDEGQVVGQGEVAVGRRGPDQGRDVLAGGAASLVGRVAVDRHGAAGGGEQPGDEAQQGGLARPVRAPHDDARPRLGDQARWGEAGSRRRAPWRPRRPRPGIPGAGSAVTSATSASPCTGRRDPSAASAGRDPARHGVGVAGGTASTAAMRGVPGVRHRD